MKAKRIKSIVLGSVLLFSFSTQVFAEQSSLSPAIQDIVSSASDCEVLAYNVGIESLDADKIFKDCVELRAILIGMQKKYGPGKYGEIDVIDKIEGYSYLAQSDNKLVKKIADSYATAAGR